MLVRHLQSCLPERIRADLQGYVPADLLEATRTELRVVAVIGAGASTPIVDRAAALVERLRQQLEPDPTRYNAELDRRATLYHLDPNAFETKLLALTREPAQARPVRDAIARDCNVRHPALLVYELVAHLMKHRFLDAIISFNFDELLDQSLSDEVGETEFARIISERDCHGVQFDARQNDFVPVYIKLHGTASDPATLRFTPHDYYAVPPRIADSVRTLLANERCIILNLGYGFQSFDFNHLLDRPVELRVYNFSYTPVAPQTIDGIATVRQHTTPPIFSDVPPPLFEDTTSVFTPNDLALKQLVQAIEAEASATRGIVRVRSSARHALVAGALSWAREVDPSDLTLKRRYLLDRTIIEVALSALRGRGLVSIDSLVHDRCVTYYDLYRDGRSVKDDVDEPWPVVCERGGLVQSEVSNETFVYIPAIREAVQRNAAARTETPEDRDARADTQIVTLDQSGIDELARYVTTQLSLRTQTQLARYGQLENDLSALQHESEVEIHVRGDSICKKVFSRPNVLPTLTSLHAATVRMLETSEYDQLAIVAETGQWLLQPPFPGILKGRKALKDICLIVAFDTVVPALLAEYQDQLHVLRAHWWRHNRHMTVACRNGEALAGIYFARRHRSLFITPVHLEEEHDREVLRKGFITYWLRTSLLPPPIGRADLRSIRLADMEQAAERLQLKHYTNLGKMLVRPSTGSP
jgi:hypothetical protein